MGHAVILRLPAAPTAAAATPGGVEAVFALRPAHVGREEVP